MTGAARRGLAATLLATGLVAGVAAPALAVGTLPTAGATMTLSPESGNNNVIPSFTTSAGCPSGSTHTYVQLFGGQLPDDGQVIKDVSRQGLSTSAGFTVEATRTFQDTFDAAAKAITAGSYRAELACINEAGTKLKTFTTDFSFSSPTAFTNKAGAPTTGTPGQVRGIENACPAATTPPNPFTDVPADNVHVKSIACIVYWKITSGKTATTYDPTGSVTRGQMAKFIANLISESGGTLPANPPSAFPDIKGSTFELAINQLAALKVISGRADGSYGPSGLVSRDAMTKFLVNTYQARTAKTLTSTKDYFTDDSGNTFEAFINQAAEAGFTGGTGGTSYSPARAVGRDAMGSFLSRVLDKLVAEDGAVRKA